VSPNFISQHILLHHCKDLRGLFLCSWRACSSLELFLHEGITGKKIITVNCFYKSLCTAKLLVTLAASITRTKPMQSPYSGKTHSQGLYRPCKALQKKSYYSPWQLALPE
jgi:hypothetical protein